MTLGLTSFRDVLAYCDKMGCSVGEAALAYEVARGERSPENVRAGVQAVLAQMRETIDRGLYETQASMSGLTGGLSAKIMAFMTSDKAFLSSIEHRMMAYALATLEENSRMRKIAACPTAGASGVVPATLMALADERSLSMALMERALLAAGLVGELISRKMQLSGSAAGCQAEVGVASGMAACALVEALEGTPEQALNATAIALKNMMGLVCDPVAGLVEVPCVKRNSLAGIQASAAATLALAGITSFVPLDEVIDAMAEVGRMMSPKLKESAEGGLARTPTALAFTENFYRN
jgi:L-serine dehydratase